MTRKQLIKAIERRIGIRLHDTDTPREVEARGRNGTPLFRIMLFEDRPRLAGWRFGGCGSLLDHGNCASLWDELCQTHEGEAV